MKVWKNLMLWYLGGMSYVALELLWRGWSHGSMFVLGGGCFLMIGEMGRRLPGSPGLLRMILGAGGITAAELLAGLVLNCRLGLHIWDYTGLPFSVLGQICLPYCLLWCPVALGAVYLDRLLRRGLFHEMPPPCPLMPKRAAARKRSGGLTQRGLIP